MYEKIITSVSNNPHYLNRYLRFIAHCIHNECKEGDSERHHICPQAMFPAYRDGRKHPWNIVRLTRRQHFVAHWLLWKAFANKPTSYAFKLMWDTYRPMRSSRTYARLKEQACRRGFRHTLETRAKMSEAKKGWKPTAEMRARMSAAQKDRSPEWRCKMGAAHKGKTVSPEAKAKISRATSGNKNPRAMIWEIEWESGQREEIKSLKSWCRERGLKYTTVYMRLRNGDNEVYRDGFRVISKFHTK